MPVWSKTTLITGSVGGAGAGQPTCKTGTFLNRYLPETLAEPIGKNSNQMTNSQTDISAFIILKSGNFVVLTVPYARTEIC